MADQLDDFASNWDRKREQTAGGVAELAQLCATLAAALDALDALDAELARVQRGDE